jgi:protein TonB
VDLSIGEDGSPGDVKPRRPGDPVSAAAAKAIESWRFEPGQEDGKPRGANASIEFDCGPTSTAAPDSSALRVGNWVLPPRVILKREPEYSKSARDARFQGSVTLGLIIDSTGHPVHLRVTQGAGLGLDEKALEAVSQWRFKPGMKDGQPVGVVVQVVVNFRLEEW